VTEPTTRSIELEVEVTGTPEEVWEAVATGPGISSWYVPTTVEEKLGGATTSSFGPTDEMQVAGRVTAWDPPRRIVFEGDGVEGGLAFEWLVEARDGGTCVVRLVNSGFGQGSEWDGEYDGMTEGWKLFMHNLQLHRSHFAGRHARAALPLATWAGPAATAWTRLTGDLGVPPSPSPGDRIAVTAGDAPDLAGTVERANPTMLSLLLDTPAPGTGFLAVEGGGGKQVMVSVWLYLYGDDRDEIAVRDEARWLDWLTARSA
jgi:uncharacterized protein YndB with AHSA1/START domain